MDFLAPIVLFVYNRPEHTKQVIEGLLTNKEASESDLYVFADGPKPDVIPESLKQLKDVREYIHSIKGFKNIFIEESTSNKGLANATIYGCTKVINKYGKIIMLEDDDVPNKYFLSYVNRCLNKFETDSRIWCVSAYTNTSLLIPKGNDDLFLVNRPSSWGFGTWKRCWDKVIWDIETLKGIFCHKDVVKGYNKWGGADSSQIMFTLFEGKNSSWSIRFNFAAYLNSSYTILPNKSLIRNTGLDGSGTHCGIEKISLQMMDHEVCIPECIQFDLERNQQLWKSFYPKSFVGKIIYFIKYRSNFSNSFKAKILHQIDNLIGYSSDK